MSPSIARLRVGLLVGATLLVLVIAGFLGYARYLKHRFLAGLPGKLGIDIRRETNGYTYSQSIKGKTVMTLHAAKAVEHKNGKLTLHDVGMILYGRKQDRADRISGAEFEYDQAAGVGASRSICTSPTAFTTPDAWSYSNSAPEMRSARSCLRPYRIIPTSCSVSFPFLCSTAFAACSVITVLPLIDCE